MCVAFIRLFEGFFFIHAFFKIVIHVANNIANPFIAFSFHFRFLNELFQMTYMCISNFWLATVWVRCTADVDHYVLLKLIDIDVRARRNRGRHGG